ncbi:MAG TPA: hypothetical protein VNF47_23980 [Streptosporangiaceae bacterium]|nr:hypothetical protein [Streptosporangiaceae bacterium]
MTADPVRLLERDEVLSVIGRHGQSAAGGNGRLLVVDAQAGLGKTSVLAAAGEHLTSSGFLRLTAQGSGLERGFAFGVVHQLLGRVAADPSSRPGLFDGVAAMASGLFGVPGAGKRYRTRRCRAIHDDSRLVLGRRESVPIRSHGCHLLPVAAAARDELRRDGRPLTRDALAARLRAEGHAVRNGRLTPLLAALRDTPAPASRARAEQERAPGSITQPPGAAACPRHRACPANHPRHPPLQRTARGRQLLFAHRRSRAKATFAFAGSFTADVTRHR